VVGTRKSQVFMTPDRLVNTWVVAATLNQPLTCDLPRGQVVISRQYLGTSKPVTNSWVRLSLNLPVA
jgi:hypothetical protein